MGTKSVRDLVNYYEDLIVAWSIHARDKPGRMHGGQTATMRSLSDVSVHYLNVEASATGKPHLGVLKMIDSVQIPKELIVAWSNDAWNKPGRMQGVQFATMRSLSDVPVHFPDVEEPHRGVLKVIESVQIPKELIVAGSIDSWDKPGRIQGIQFATMLSLSVIPVHYPEVEEPHRGVLKVIDFVQTTDNTPFRPEPQSNEKPFGIDCLKHVARWLSHFFRLHRPSQRSSSVRSGKRRV